MTDTLLSLLQEARRDWIKDTRLEGDQYGGVTVPTGEAMRAFGARIDALLGSMQRHAIIVTSKEAKAIGGHIATKEGTKFWVTYNRHEHWDSSTLVDSALWYGNEIPSDVKTFKSQEDAERFAKSWPGHPWWCKPKAWEIVPLIKVYTGKYVRA